MSEPADPPRKKTKAECGRLGGLVKSPRKSKSAHRAAVIRQARDAVIRAVKQWTEGGPAGVIAAAYRMLIEAQR